MAAHQEYIPAAQATQRVAPLIVVFGELPLAEDLLPAIADMVDAGLCLTLEPGQPGLQVVFPVLHIVDRALEAPDPWV